MKDSSENEESAKRERATRNKKLIMRDDERLEVGSEAPIHSLFRGERKKNDNRIKGQSNGGR
jgi:hypothetical protein